MTLTMVLFYSSVSIRPDIVTVSQHAQCQQYPENDAVKWNSAIINFIIHTCSFPTMTCQHVLCEIGLLFINLKCSHRRKQSPFKVGFFSFSGCLTMFCIVWTLLDQGLTVIEASATVNPNKSGDLMTAVLCDPYV